MYPLNPHILQISKSKGFINDQQTKEPPDLFIILDGVRCFYYMCPSTFENLNSGLARESSLTMGEGHTYGGGV